MIRDKVDDPTLAARGGGAAGGMVFRRYGGMDGSEFRPGYSSPRNDEVGRGVPWRGQPGPRPGSGMNRGRPSLKPA